MDNTAQQDLLGRLLDRVAALEGELKTLKATNTEHAVEHDDEPMSRRGLLKKVGGVAAAGLAGATAAGVLSPATAHAANGDAVILGQDNFGGLTGIVNGDSRAYFADPSIASQGLMFKNYGVGVDGKILGYYGVGVMGETSGHWSQTAVIGNTDAGNGEGIGVHGQTKNGIGVLAEATGGGYGLQVKGRAVFSRSGKVTIAQGQAVKAVSVSITPASLVLAVIQGYEAGVWVAGVVLELANNRFTIRLNKVAPKNLTVGWFVVN